MVNHTQYLFIWDSGGYFEFRGHRRRLGSPTHSSPPPAKHLEPTVAKTCLTVSVSGQMYTSLSWYFLKDNPSNSYCQRARKKCATNALVLAGGHTRSVKEFAGNDHVTLRPLCRIKKHGEWKARQRLGDAAVDTEVVGVRISRAEQPLKARLSQVLWLVSDLDAEFK